MLFRSSPDGQHQNQTGYILCSQRWRSSIQSAKTTLGADCGSDHETLIAKFRLKLKKVGKTMRPFRFDLNKIPYDYTVEVRNKFKGLDLIDKVPEEVWMEVHDIHHERHPQLGIVSALVQSPLSFWSYFSTLPVAYWAPTDLRISSFSGISFCLLILFMGFSSQDC